MHCQKKYKNKLDVPRNLIIEKNDNTESIRESIRQENLVEEKRVGTPELRTRVTW